MTQINVDLIQVWGLLLGRTDPVMLFYWTRTSEAGIRRAYADAEVHGEIIMFVWTEPMDWVEVF